MAGGFRLGWLIVLPVIAVQIYGAYTEEQRDEPISRRPKAEMLPEPNLTPRPVRGGRALPSPSSRDPTFSIETGVKGNSVGTAFAIRDDGLWLTARHVVDGCDQVGLVVAPRRAVAVERVLSHPRADMAVLWTRRRAPALSISREELRARQNGFHIGFPQGEPGQVTSTLLGRRNLRTTGRYRHTEPVIAWAEQARAPQTDTLGGISGGPALNAAGEIVGVTIASSRRRGRVFTTAPVSMDSMLKLAGARARGRPSAGLAGPSVERYVAYGTALRRQLTVAKVICRVGKQRRRRRR